MSAFTHGRQGETEKQTWDNSFSAPLHTIQWSSTTMITL
jgi:hypothetical protein